MFRLVRPMTGILCLLAMSAAASASTWQFQKNPDPLGTGYVAMANAPGAAIQPMVRCWTEAATLDVRFALSPQTPLPISDEVVVVFDGQRPVTVKWPRNATGRALVVPATAHRALLAKLRAASELRLTLATAEGDSPTWVIALDGSARAIDQALSGCS